MVKDMTHGSPLKLIISFAIPMFLGILFQQFYSMVDTMIVGKFLGVGPPGRRRLYCFFKFYGHWLLHRRMQRLCHPRRSGFWRPQ